MLALFLLLVTYSAGGALQTRFMFNPNTQNVACGGARQPLSREPLSCELTLSLLISHSYKILPTSSLKRARILSSEAMQMLQSISRICHLRVWKSTEPGQAETFARFLDLPVELRVAIYEMDLLYGEPIRLSWADDSCNIRIPHILATNRQVRKEASKVFYSNRFEARVFCNAQRFLDHLQPASIACLKSLNVWSSAFAGFAGTTKGGQQYMLEALRLVLNCRVADYTKKGLKAEGVIIPVPVDDGTGTYRICNLRLTDVAEFEIVKDGDGWTVARRDCN